MAAAYSPNAIIIGAGPSGIALAYRLKHELGFEDFLVNSGVCSLWVVQALTRLLDIR